jgi:hypothetical protein
VHISVISGKKSVATKSRTKAQPKMKMDFIDPKKIQDGIIGLTKKKFKKLLTAEEFEQVEFHFENGGIRFKGPQPILDKIAKLIKETP